jgi:hypothetical protein
MKQKGKMIKTYEEVDIEIITLIEDRIDDCIEIDQSDIDDIIWDVIGGLENKEELWDIILEHGAYGSYENIN